MLKKKPYIETHKAMAEKELALRLERLRSEGIDEKRIQRDTTVRQFKGRIRQASQQLDRIAAVEALNAHKAEIKADKQSAPKVPEPKKRHTANPEKAKARKEKRVAAAQRASDESED